MRWVVRGDSWGGAGGEARDRQGVVDVLQELLLAGVEAPHKLLGAAQRVGKGLGQLLELAQARLE